MPQPNVGGSYSSDGGGGGRRGAAAGHGVGVGAGGDVVHGVADNNIHAVPQLRDREHQRRRVADAAMLDCACLILTGNVPFSLPINRTLAISLPRICSSMSVPLQCRGWLQVATDSSHFLHHKMQIFLNEQD
ncbi:non-specific lipid-transfer protein-like protein [Panicum miliaceum]|uniref:Non-specific lipid-transfer protein-like protein n=1 Tax=Panicum miliaceum TaxID=4540 RepID=A0A3L6PYA2_PANMI|nr:non-specific lipid-transfer protein-like protein [Panicum miliaceum]